MTFPKKALIAFLPQPTDDPNVTALASVRTERFVPANTATTFTLGNLPIADTLKIYKNGTRMDDGAGTPAFTIKGSVVTVAVAANGTDVYLCDYSFHTSR